MDSPAIAVVIPAHNAGRFVNEAIESVCGQTISQWECVIVDDGSADETPQRLASYRDPRIRWIRQENSGSGAARAQGMLLTLAPKIVFLDADDQLYADALARYVAFLDRHATVGVAYGERTLIDESGNAFGLEWRAVLNKHPEGDVLASIVRRPFLSTPAQACFRREAVPRVEWSAIRIPPSDWFLLASTAVHHTFGYVGRAPMVKYRVHRTSSQRRIVGDPQSAPHVREFNEFLERLFSFPDMENRFDAARLVKLRRAAEASCFAIKGQEFLRHNEPSAARRYFWAAIQSGSRDCRDLLCWAATFSPALLRWTAPLFGTVSSQT